MIRRYTFDEIEVIKAQATEVAAAKLAASERDLDAVLDYVRRQGGFVSGDDARMLRGVRARREDRR